MLFYLDNFFNQAVAPNENYARELMELHTLGVDGGYTEADIKEDLEFFNELKDEGGPEIGNLANNLQIVLNYLQKRKLA